MVSVVKMIIVAGGIWKCGVMWRSMVRACWMAKEKLCDAAAMSVMLAAHSGSMRTMDLSSSTRCTVDTRHRFGSPVSATSPVVSTAARSKNLHKPPVGGDWSVELLVLVQQADVLRHGLRPLLERRDDDLQQPLEGASLGLHLHVQWVADDEREHGDEHGDGRDPESPTPPHVLLDVHHHGERQEHGEPHAEEVEVELHFCSPPGRLPGRPNWSAPNATTQGRMPPPPSAVSSSDRYSMASCPPPARWQSEGVAVAVLPAAHGAGRSAGASADTTRPSMPSWYSAPPPAMVQKRPAQESAMMAPRTGVKAAIPLKLVSRLDASTSGRCSCCVRYVIMLALKPAVANLSQISFAAGRTWSSSDELASIVNLALALEPPLLEFLENHQRALRHLGLGRALRHLEEYPSERSEGEKVRVTSAVRMSTGSGDIVEG
ncbi:LOW QUALITY PROTEIN: hypothetical protein U9M48_043967 [Paspalum notatum var. saurae]|uniref:Uncharacterized protein n=1 Tax=Paspalum notatum var. saurae TaxID=547442 RepID=A0AAQ3UU74_PASNO